LKVPLVALLVEMTALSLVMTTVREPRPVKPEKSVTFHVKD